MDPVHYDGGIINFSNANSVSNVVIASSIGVYQNSSVFSCDCNNCSKPSKCRQRKRIAFWGGLLSCFCMYLLLLLFAVVFEEDL